MSDPRLFGLDEIIDDLNVNDLQAVMAKMAETPGMEFGFDIKVTVPRAAEETFSMDSLATLRDHMISWVGTRLHRYYKRTGRGAKSMQVHILVSLDGQPPEKLLTVPFISWADSQHRGKKE